MRQLPAALLSLVMSLSAFGQTYTISTFAGGALPVNIAGTSASLGDGPQYVAADRAGNLFFPVQHAVLRLDATTGILTLAAGNGTTGFSGDNGPATSAQLNFPTAVAVDSAGNLYIIDSGNSRIRRVSNGVITTVAGNGTAGFSGDNGPATSAQVSPGSLAVDSAGNVYITDGLNGSRVRKVSNGVITTVAGNGTNGFSGDNGPATSASFSASGVAVDSTGNLYIADGGSNRIRKVSEGVITTVAGNGTPGFNGDNGPATSAQLGAAAVAVDSAGNLYIADLGTNRIRKVSNGVITTVAGTAGGGFGGDNGPATSAQLNGPRGVAVDSAGNFYIIDSGSNRIRKVSNGVITTVAGNGTAFSGDNGPAASAQLSVPGKPAVDSFGNLYITDGGNDRIRKVSNGVITTTAGNGTTGFSGDNGPATSAQLSGPVGVAVDSAGNLYVATSNDGRIRKVSNGVITTVAGSGTAGFSGDNGPATSAQVSLPQSLTVDSAGNLYIADTNNNRIRKVSNGVITTVAGNGTYGFSGDNGSAASAQLAQPYGVAVDSAGNLYIADTSNHRIRKVSNGGITTVAGNGTPGFSGDNGPASSAQLYTPLGVAVDPVGNVYIADSFNNRVRLLTPAGSSCTYAVSPTALQAPAAGANLTVSIQTIASCSWTIANLPAWINVSSASSGAGSATVTLVVTPNSGGPLSASILIAGVSVTVTQLAASGCSYAISPGGQAFAEAGGNGTINITAGAGCPWTAASTASWVTITGVGAGSGNGTVTYQAAANTGAARSGSVGVAGLSFTVEEGSALITGFTNAGSMAQLASAGFWTTTITLVNTGTTPVQARLNFFDDSGNPLILTLSFPQSSSAAGPLLASTLDRTVNPGAELVIQSTGPNSQPTLVGWAQLLANGTIGGFAVYSQAIGNANQEAEIPLEIRNVNGYVVPFDNTSGSATGVALANISPLAVNSAVTIRDDTGAVLLQDTITLPAMGHTSFNLTDRYAPTTARRRGTLEFRTPLAGQISVLGLRFNATGAFSTIPALVK